MLLETKNDCQQDKSDRKLVRMGNQIATFFSSQNQKNAASGVAEHINKFWEPRMRRQLFQLSARSTEGFHPLFIEALPHINKPDGV